MAELKLSDTDLEKGRIALVGKGGWQRAVAFNSGAKRALWRYMLHRPNNGQPWLWLTEGGGRLNWKGSIALSHESRLVLASMEPEVSINFATLSPKVRRAKFQQHRPSPCF